MKRLPILLAPFFLVCCEPDKLAEDSCNNAKVKNVTVVDGVRFGMGLGQVLDIVRPDTFVVAGTYPDTSVTFIADFYGVPARYYMDFDKYGLSDLQIRAAYDISPNIDDLWRDSVSLIYGRPEKIKFQGSANAYYWRWILCDGGRAVLSSSMIFNTPN